MTNEEKVEQYFAEIEKVFGTKEKMLTYLSRYDNADEKTKEMFDQITVGRYHKEYWVKFEVKEPSLLNSFLMSWVINGKSIAGVQGSVLDYGGVCDKNELKQKIHKYINEL